jgi:hypothetical protein
MLNLSQAFELYDLIIPYLPKTIEKGELTISYVSRILGNIRDGSDPDVFTRIMILLTGLSRRELIAFDVKDIVDTFMVKLVENKILDLVKYMQEIGYGSSSNGR